MKNSNLMRQYRRISVFFGSFFTFFTSAILFLTMLSPIKAQTEVMAWGNMTGIRIEGQLMDFESSLRVVGKNWESLNATGKERQSPKYDREGQTQSVTTSIGKIKFSQIVDDVATGNVKVSVKVTADQDTLLQGIFFTLDLSDASYANAEVKFINGSPSGKAKLNLSRIDAANNANPYKVTAKGVVISTPKKQIEVGFGTGAVVYVRKETGITPGTQIYIELLGQNIKKGQEIEKTFAFKASGEIDKSPAEMVLDVKNPGRLHVGFGGNFRLQSNTDPQVIDYCLNNLRVAFGRAEMPWSMWQPNEDSDPIAEANAGKLNPNVKAAMEMAQRLAQKGMPVILSDWSAPAWAVLGNPRDAYRVRPDGLRG
ncbi:MAG: hypothetical protein PHS48_10290, partial [Bacteroidales bacterium]|nr:hypothetical protein [Bacteroidales bacterium]